MRPFSENTKAVTDPTATLSAITLHGQKLAPTWQQLKNSQQNWQLLEEFIAIANQVFELSKQLPDSSIGQVSEKLKKRLHCVHGKRQPDTNDRQAIEELLTSLTACITEMTNDQTPKSIEPNQAPTLSQTIKIALLEDNQQLEKSIKHHLNKEGYRVYPYHDLGALTQALSSKTFDIILLDYAQPDRPLANAITLADLVASNPDHIPMVMLADQEDFPTRLAALRGGIRAYITKPVESDELIAKVGTILNQHRENQTKVLIVDDDKVLTELYMAGLSEKGFAVECINQPMDILQRIHLFQPDVITLNYEMPWCSGLEVAEILRGDPRYMNIPIVFISDSEEAAKHKELISIFGNVFLEKPVDIYQLCNTLTKLTCKAKKVNDTIDKISVRRSSEHLQNRDYFLHSLEALLHSASVKNQEDANHYIVMITVDNLPEAKEKLDKGSFNKLMATLENFFAKHTLAQGQGCIFGEGTYLLQLRDTQRQHPDMLLRNFHESFAQKFVPDMELLKPLTISTSALAIDQTSPSTIEEVITSIESVNLTAAHHGNNQIHWVKTKATHPSKKIDKNITAALKKQSFQLAFQPIIKPESDHHIFDVLVRLVDDKGKLYLPESFLPYLNDVLEDGPQILDRWIIEHAFHALEHASSHGSEEFSIIIKLWPDLQHIKRLLPFIFNMVSNSPLHGEHRKIYFSTSAQAVFSDMKKAKYIANALHQANCGFVIDHWLGDEASISNIAELETVDFIKLDPNAHNQVNNIVRIKKVINKLNASLQREVNIVASLVEDAQTFAHYWEMNIRYFQGYFIHQPSNIIQQQVFEGESLLIDR